MAQLSLRARRFIVRKKAENHGAKNIRKLLRSELQVTAALKTIQEVMKKHRETGSVHNRAKQREFKFGTQEHEVQQKMPLLYELLRKRKSRKGKREYVN